MISITAELGSWVIITSLIWQTDDNTEIVLYAIHCCRIGRQINLILQWFLASFFHISEVTIAYRTY